MTELLSKLSLGKTRLAKECGAMEDSFPEANLLALNTNKQQAGWRVGISIGETVYDVLVAYHEEFPYQPPNVFVIEPDIDPSRTPHMCQDGSLSLGNKHEWTPSGTAATGVVLAARWLQALEVYQDEGVWPEVERTTINSFETVEMAENTCEKDSSPTE